ncbi:MAG: hypothetical protein ACRENE_16530 [Polyangiaceae bacterium]
MYTSESGRIRVDVLPQLERFERSLYHEAGHAVVALAVGVRVKSVMVTNEDACVVTLRRRREPPLAEGDVERMVALEVAGYLAERRVDWRKRAWARRCSETDFANAGAWVLQGSGPVVGLRCLRMAWRLVTTHWSAIAGVADALRSRSILGETELFGVVDEHGLDPRTIDGYEEAIAASRDSTACLKVAVC